MYQSLHETPPPTRCVARCGHLLLAAYAVYVALLLIGMATVSPIAPTLVRRARIEAPPRTWDDATVSIAREARIIDSFATTAGLGNVWETVWTQRRLAEPFHGDRLAMMRFQAYRASCIEQIFEVTNPYWATHTSAKEFGKLVQTCATDWFEFAILRSNEEDTFFRDRVPERVDEIPFYLQKL